MMIGQFLKRIFRIGPPDKPVRGSSVPKAPGMLSTAAAATAAGGEDSFSTRLGLLAGEESRPESLVAGSLELVGLDDIKEALGERWSAIEASAKEIAETELQRHLDEEDFYRPYGETAFLVCFSELEKPAADKKAQQIGASIKARLAREIPDVANAVTVDHFVASIDRSSLRGGNEPIADRLYGTLAHMREEARQTTEQFRQSLLRDFQLLFLPTWHTRKEVVVLNRCQLDMASGCTTLAQFQALADPLLLGRTLVDLDLLLLTKSLEALHQMLQTRRGSAIMVPVSYKTIAQPGSQAEYQHLLDLMPEAYRKFVVLEVCEVPVGATERLGELIQQFARYAKGIVIDVGFDEAVLSQVLPHCPWGISVNLASSSSIDPQTAVRLRRIVSLAAGAPVRTIAQGANSIGLALAAFEAGFSYVNGPAIHPTMREPKPMSPLNPLPNSAHSGRVLRDRSPMIFQSIPAARRT